MMLNVLLVVEYVVDFVAADDSYIETRSMSVLLMKDLMFFVLLLVLEVVDMMKCLFLKDSEWCVNVEFFDVLYL